MTVKKKDRHVAKNESLKQSRYLVQYVMTITRSAELDESGNTIKKPGLLGDYFKFNAFGFDLLNLSKAIHSKCYKANKINLKDKETLDRRNVYHREAIEYCNQIFQIIDLCIFQYAMNNKKKRKSFYHLSKLTRNVKKSLQDRINRDNLIYSQKYKE